jgi:hypothetical protein
LAERNTSTDDLRHRIRALHRACVISRDARGQFIRRLSSRCVTALDLRESVLSGSPAAHGAFGSGRTRQDHRARIFSVGVCGGGSRPADRVVPQSSFRDSVGGRRSRPVPSAWRGQPEVICQLAAPAGRPAPGARHTQALKPLQAPQRFRVIAARADLDVLEDCSGMRNSSASRSPSLRPLSATSRRPVAPAAPSKILVRQASSRRPEGHRDPTVWYPTGTTTQVPTAS